MIVYLLKSVLCGWMLLAGYTFFLEKEKMHTFKRYYLLISLACFLFVPLIYIDFIPVVFQQWDPLAENTLINRIDDPDLKVEPTVLNTIEYLGNTADKPSFNDILLLLYLPVSGVLLGRFVLNLLKLFHDIRKRPRVRYGNAWLVLKNAKCSPHSFLNYIFVDSMQYKCGTLKPEILTHELTHVQQKHSLDILLLELITVFVWFHPLIHLYKKKIKLNHEFLADEQVVKTTPSITHYQLILLTMVRYKII